MTHADGERRPARVPRVLFAIGGLDTGGSEHQLVELVLRAHPSRIHAIVLTWDPSENAPARERLAEAGIEHVALGPFSVPRRVRPPLALIRLGRLVRTLKPDVSYAWLEQASFLITPVSRVHGIPVVIARRNVSGVTVERVPPIGLAVRRVERLANVVTANSQAVLEAARGRGIRADRLRYVPNGHARAEPLPEPPFPPVRLGYVAKFRPEKGHYRLLSALTRVRARVAWEVGLAGDGPLEDDIARNVQRLGLADRVRLLGPVADMRRYWAEHAVGVLLSDHEGSPNALIEAAFAGRPLLGTHVGGIPEVIAPDGGILVSPTDEGAIATALEQLIDDADSRRKLGAQAHQQAHARFSMERFVDGHVSAIYEALAQGRDGRAVR